MLLVLTASVIDPINFNRHTTFPLNIFPVQLGHGSELPESPPDQYQCNEPFLKEAHRVLVEVEVVEGELECPESGRKFPITEGIPNMLLREDEV